MARTKDSSLSERNRRICLLRRNGFTYSEIAQMEGVSRVRVAQIVAEHNAELPEDEGRAEIGSILEFAERKAVELINDPGPMMAPNGRPATDEDGAPILNRGIVVEGLKTLVLISDKKSRLYGWDKQVQKQMDRPAAEAAMWAALADARAQKEVSDADRKELEAYRQRFGQVIPGEVVAELPPGA